MIRDYFQERFADRGGRADPQLMHEFLRASTTWSITETVDLYASHQTRLRPQWIGRPLEVGLIKNFDYNAVAASESKRDFIGIYVGAVLGIHGTVFSLLSHPAAFPEIGDPSQEAATFDRAPHGLPLAVHNALVEKNSLLYSDQPPDTRPALHTALVAREIPIPRCWMRRVYAGVLADTMLLFLLYHELGHLLHGHTFAAGMPTDELLERDNRLRLNVDADRRILESEADRFAARWTTVSSVGAKLDAVLGRCINGDGPRRAQPSLFMVIEATELLFRLCDPNPHASPSEITPTSPYPHPRTRLLMALIEIGVEVQVRNMSEADPVHTATTAVQEQTRAMWARFGLPGTQRDGGAWIEPIEKETRAMLATLESTEGQRKAQSRLA